MKKELEEAFNSWWNANDLLQGNPYKVDSKAYWAWEGYFVGVKAERERIIKLATFDFAGDACDFGEWLRKELTVQS